MSKKSNCQKAIFHHKITPEIAAKIDQIAGVLKVMIKGEDFEVEKMVGFKWSEITDEIEEIFKQEGIEY